jgi:hypothetical protein
VVTTKAAAARRPMTRSRGDPYQRRLLISKANENLARKGHRVSKTGDPSLLAHLNLASFSLFCLRQHDRDHAVLHQGADFALIDLV